MSKTTITIELDLGPGYEQDPETGEFYPTDRESFDEQIISRVVSEFASRINYEGRKKLDDAVTRKADELIEQRLDAEINRIVSGPLQRYDYSGNPKGEPFTVNELIVQAVEKFAAAPAGRRDSYSGRREGNGNLSDVVEDAVADALKTELAKDVADIRSKVAAEIKDRLTGAAAAAIVKAR
jgi:hypothetical protein